MGLFQRNLQLMHMRTVPGKNYSMPESVEDLVTSLDRQRPVFTMAGTTTLKCATPG